MDRSIDLAVQPIANNPNDIPVQYDFNGVLIIKNIQIKGPLK